MSSSFAWRRRRGSLGLRSSRYVVDGLEPRRLLAVITVDSTDGAPTLGDGKVTLSEAITAANNNANFGDAVGVGAYGADVIRFNIPGAGVRVITLTGALPVITDTLTIDGYTQPGASANTLAVGNNANLLVELRHAAGGQNVSFGVLNMQADNCVVRGLVINSSTQPDDINVDDNHAGIRVSGKNVKIEGNFIGTNAAGTAAMKNSVGISLAPGSDGATIGGTTPASRNVISGNSHGLYVNSPNAVVQGNYIGTSASGSAAIGNTIEGVRFSRGDATLGGTVAGSGNVISANGVGVHVRVDSSHGPATNLSIQGNLIGTDATGAGALGNVNTGVLVGESDVTIGGTAAGQGNVIANTTFKGVELSPLSKTPVNVRILGNSIHSNGLSGIASGGTFQDDKDADTGLNGNQNIPLLDSAVQVGGGTSVNYRLTTTPSTNYRVEFFSVTEPNVTGFGEGRTFLASVDVATNASGAFAGTMLLPAITPGQYVSATVTGPEGTSEFSIARTVQAAADSFPLVVTNTNDSGAGSLRQAMLNANLQVNAGGVPDVITFNIPGTGVHTIQPLTQLPLLDDGVFVNGYSQPGSSANTLALGNNAALRIEIDGSLAGSTANGIRVSGPGSSVRGLVVNRFAAGGNLALPFRMGIEVLPGATGTVVAGNFVGTDPTGTIARPNNQGIIVTDAADALVGGPDPADRNLASGNTKAGIELFGLARNVRVHNNYAGTNAAGTAALANKIGLSISSGGGALTPSGIDPGTLVGGTSSTLRNVFSGNTQVGILNVGIFSQVQGNFIGTDREGKLAVANGSAGIGLIFGQMIIGGAAPGAGNVISGNGRHGIDVNSVDVIGLVTGGTTFPGNIYIEGNRIGTDADGIAAVPNASDGVHVALALGVFIGGSTAAQGNIISGNLGNGIGTGGGSFGADLFISGLIENNRIGLNANDQPLGNEKDGIGGELSDIRVGDPAIPGSGNRIAHNKGNGINLFSKDATSSIATTISQNQVFSNGKLGIDLGNDGITSTQDNLDADAGDNGLQNVPILSDALTSAGSTEVRAQLTTKASKTYRVEFFSSPAADSSGFGEGATYLGFANVTTNASGAADQTVTLPVAVNVGDVITATATVSPVDVLDPDGTSEFSQAVVVAAAAVPPTFTINDVSQSEGTGAGPTTFTFTVTRTGDTTGTNVITYATADGTATIAGGDYAETSGSLTFAPGDTAKTVTVSVTADGLVEPDETFFVNLSFPAADLAAGRLPPTPVIEDGQGQGTIVNDDVPPTPATFSINDVSQAEGTGATPTSFTFTVTRGGNTTGTDVVNYASADGTATVAGGDYALAGGALTFTAGQTSKIVTVEVTADADVESDETFFVNLSLPMTSAGVTPAPTPTITDGEGKGTIVNDDQPPVPTTFSIGDVSKNEGTGAGPTLFTFVVTRAGNTANTDFVSFATADGTATVAGADYASASGTLTFSPGETTKDVVVEVTADAVVEVDETFLVNLSLPPVVTGQGGPTPTITDGQGQGTIVNDDALPPGPVFSIDDVSMLEGTGVSATSFVFTVTRTGNTDRTDVIEYDTANGTATVAGNDYTPITDGRITFLPGDTSKTITISVTADAVVETDETFFVNLSLLVPAGTPPSGPPTIGDGQGQGTIRNDDQPPTPTAPTLSIADVSMTEGNSGTKQFVFTVTRTGDTSGASTVKWATQNSTAGEGDYGVAGGTLSFAAGQTSKTIAISVKGDTKVEADEVFFVNLSNPTGATIADGQGKGTILNDDTTPPANGAIKGHVFDDRNANTRRDGSSEPVLSGWTVYIDTDNDGKRDANERTATTNSAGDYTFANVGPGRYVIRIVLKSGWRQVKPPEDDPHVVQLAQGQTVIDRGFGVTRTASVAGTVFRDRDRDGKLDAGESGFAGRTVFIDKDNDGKLDAGELSTTTDGSGRYTFAAVPSGTARVRLALAGSTPTSPSNGLKTLSLSAAQVVTAVNFGLR